MPTRESGAAGGISQSLRYSSVSSSDLTPASSGNRSTVGQVGDLAHRCEVQGALRLRAALGVVETRYHWVLKRGRLRAEGSAGRLSEVEALV